MNPRVKEFVDRVEELQRQFGLVISFDEICGEFMLLQLADHAEALNYLREDLEMQQRRLRRKEGVK